MKRFQFTVCEIEHDGDLDYAWEAVQKAGGKNVEVLETDFEGGESAVFRCDVDDGETRKSFLEKVEEHGGCV